MPQSPLPEVEFSVQFQSGGAWSLVRLHATEALNEVYEYALEVATREALTPSDLLGGTAVVTLARDGADRKLCGLVAAVTDRGFVGAHRVAEVVLVPALWTLGQRTSTRIFQEVDALAAVELVLREAGVYQGAAFEKVIAITLPVREYCTQYEETDLAFVRRLLEEEGLAFYFKHEGETETLVIADGSHDGAYVKLSSKSLPGNADRAKCLPVEGQGGATDDRETVRNWEPAWETVPTAVSLRDYDFTHPDAILTEQEKAAGARGDRTRFEYPARFVLGPYQGTVYGAPNTARVGAVRLAQATGRASGARARSNMTLVHPGMKVDVMLEDASEALTRVVTRVVHTGEAPEVLYQDRNAGGEGSSRFDRYSNVFDSIADDVVYRPARVTPRPRALSPQSAKVVADTASSTEKIHTDEYGRVKVQFQWDRPSERPGNQSAKAPSCWLRVAQAWAGEGWGFLFIPRIGMEVVVQFLDGDPDRPFVAQCLYNATHLPPVTLPGQKTHSVIRSQSVPGTGAKSQNGFNELSFEDGDGQEEVYLHAQRNQREKVLNDHLVEVDHDETETVLNDQTHTVGRHRTTKVRGNEVHSVTGDSEAEGAGEVGNRTTKIAGNDSTEVEKDVTLNIFGKSTVTVAKTHTVTVDERITETVGGAADARLDMAPDAITVSIGPTKLKLTKQNALLEVSGVKIEMTATSITLDVNGNKVELAPAGVTTKTVAGAKIEAQGPNVTVQSPAIVQVQGSLVKIN